MPSRPHIVLFNPDQWRADVLGHLGNPAAMTPNLDRLVETEAVSFSNAFCQNPVCTPSRCSFMTGWYPHVRGHRTMHHMLHVEQGETNLLRLLKENGYLVWWGGKNDLVPGQHGFKEHCDVKFQPTGEDFKRWGYTPRPGLHSWVDWRGEPGSDTYFGFYAGKLDTKGEPLYCDHDWANILGAVDFIRSYDGDRPLCIYLPIGYPHPPYGVEDPWFSAIDREKLPQRIPVPSVPDGKPSILAGIREGQGLQGWTEDRWTMLRAVYYGMCARVDHQLGFVVNALRETEMFDDTALFLFADHGDFTGDYGLVEKTQNTFEDCLTHVPFVVKPPAERGTKTGINHSMVELLDLFATVCEMAGIEPPFSHFSRSLLPLLSGETREHRDAVFCEGGRLKGETHAMERESAEKWKDRGQSPYWPRLKLQTSDDGVWHTKAAMCRTRDFKYVRRHYESDEFYDLRKDPGETVNRIADPEYKDVIASLKERMLQWYMETGDVVPHVTDSRF